MHWTSEPPTEPGWYWVAFIRRPGAWAEYEREPEVVRLEREDFGQHRLVPFYAGDDRSYFDVADDTFDAQQPVRWAGPLTPPSTT